MNQEKTLTLSVVLMLAGDMVAPSRSVKQDRIGFFWRDAGMRQKPMMRFFDALPSCHKHILRSQRTRKHSRSYISPEAMRLWRQWNGEQK